MNTRSKRFLGFGLGVLLLCGTGGFAVMKWGGRGERDLQDQLDRAVRLGMPKTPADLITPLDDPNRNAAISYRRFAAIPGFFAKRTGRTPNFYPVNAAEMEEIDRFLFPYKAPLAQFESATTLPEYRFDRKFDYSDEVFPTEALILHGAELLIIRARRESAGDEPVRAIRTLTSAARACAHLGTTPVLISKFNQTGMESQVLQTAQEILGEHGMRPEVRSATRKLLAALGPDIRMKDTLRSEWLFQRNTLGFLHTGKASLDDVKEQIQVAEEKKIGKTDATIYGLRMQTRAGRLAQEVTTLRFVLDQYEALPDDPMDIRGARKACKDVQDKLDKAGVDAMYAQVAVPPLPDAFDMAAEANVRRRLLTALLTALDSPVPPKTLPLSGTEATDPFSGKPYGYRATSKQIVIWSVGRDGHDDGGLFRAGSKSFDDIVAWPYPKKRPKPAPKP